MLPRLHDVAHGNALEQEDLRGRLLGDDELGIVTGQGPIAVGLAGGGGDRGDEASDDLAGEVLQVRCVGHRAVVGADPVGPAGQPLESRSEGVGAQVGAVPGPRGLEQLIDLLGVGQAGRVQAPQGDRVLDVVDGVADVVGQVHDLRLDAAPALRSPLTHPGEDLGVVVVGGVLARTAPARSTRPPPLEPRVLRDGVEAGPRQVDADRPPGCVKGLGLQPGQDPEGLGIALEAPDLAGHDVERLLTVVPVGRVAQVMGQAGGVDDVGVASQRLPQGAPHLRHFQGVGEPGAHEVVSSGPQHLGLGPQAPQRRGVQDPGPVAFERGALGILRLLVNEALHVLHPVPGQVKGVSSVDTHRFGSRFLR